MIQSMLRAPPIEWRISPRLVEYETALIEMDQRVGAIHRGEAPEQVWLLEHPALFTAGTKTNWADLYNPELLPVYETGRGGQLTYHGPGQRVCYVMVDVKKRFAGDVRAFVQALENWLIITLRDFQLKGETRDGRTGVWVTSRDATSGSTDAKIAAIGIRVRHGISLHGVSLNVCPNLDHYEGIVPCGISEHGVTSLNALGHDLRTNAADTALETAFVKTFGAELVRPSPLTAPAQR